MTNLKYLFLVFLPALMLFNISCSDHNNTDDIAMVDSMNTILNNLKDTMRSGNIAEYRNIYDKVKENNIFFQSILFDMPEDKEFRKKFFNYGVVDKTLKTFFSKLNSIKREIEVAESQLKNLKHDIGHNLLSGEEINKYINDELSVLDSIKEQLNIQFEKVSVQVKSYNDIHESIDEFKENLKEEIAKERDNK